MPRPLLHLTLCFAAAIAAPANATDFLGSRDLSPAWRQQMLLDQQRRARDEADERAALQVPPAQAPEPQITEAPLPPLEPKPTSTHSKAAAVISTPPEPPQRTGLPQPATLTTRADEAAKHVFEPFAVSHVATFKAKAGEDIRTTVTRWAMKFGYFVQPRDQDSADEPWVVTHDDEFTGEFLEALYWLRDGFARKSPVPNFELTKDKTVIVKAFYR